MSPSRVILVVVSACLVLAHLSGNMRGFLGAFDIDIDARDIPYVLAIPGVALFTIVMLRN